MPDDQNVPVGGAGQTHSARVKFASDTVREKVGELLAEAGGNLAPAQGEGCCAAESAAVADIIRNCNSVAAGNNDVIRLEHDGEDVDTTQVNIWYKLADLDGGGTANDMVVYNDAAGGDANVLVILQNYDTALTNDDFHEDVTLVEATNAATTADIL